jgi:hypothetical protein
MEKEFTGNEKGAALKLLCFELQTHAEDGRMLLT